MTDSQLKALLTSRDDEASLRQAEQWRALRTELGLDRRANAEARARDEEEEEAKESRRGWSFSWATAGLAAAVVAGVTFGLIAQGPSNSPSASVKAAGPGVAASSYYSPRAQAEIVWITGGEKGSPQKPAAPHGK